MSATRSSPERSALDELGQSGLCRLHEPPRHRGLRRPAASLLHGLAHRLEACAIAAGGELGEHAAHDLSAEQVGRRRRHVCRQLHLCGLVGVSKPLPPDGHLAASQGDEPAVGAVAHCGSVRVVLTPLSGEQPGLVVHDDVEHLEPCAHREGEQALLELAGEVGDRHGHCVRQRERRLVGGLVVIEFGLLWRHPTGVARAVGGGLVVLSHDGPLPVRMSCDDARDLPPGRHQAGDRHSKIHAQGDNLLLTTTTFLGEWPDIFDPYTAVLVSCPQASSPIGEPSVWQRSQLLVLGSVVAVRNDDRA